MVKSIKICTFRVKSFPQLIFLSHPPSYFYLAEYSPMFRCQQSINTILKTKDALQLGSNNCRLNDQIDVFSNSIQKLKIIFKKDKNVTYVSLTIHTFPSTDLQDQHISVQHHLDLFLFFHSKHPISLYPRNKLS